MSALAVICAVGLGFGVLPWRFSVLLGGLLLGLWVLLRPDVPLDRMHLLAAPALLMGWGMGLLILRRITERGAK